MRNIKGKKLTPCGDNIVHISVNIIYLRMRYIKSTIYVDFYGR